MTTLTFTPGDVSLEQLAQVFWNEASVVLNTDCPRGGCGLRREHRVWQIGQHENRTKRHRHPAAKSDPVALLRGFDAD